MHKRCMSCEVVAVLDMCIMCVFFVLVPIAHVDS